MLTTGLLRILSADLRGCRGQPAQRDYRGEEASEPGLAMRNAPSLLRIFGVFIGSAVSGDKS